MEALKTALSGGRKQFVVTVGGLNSGDGQQIALRHTGELVKEAAERDNGRFSLHCQLKG